MQVMQSKMQIRLQQRTSAGTAGLQHRTAAAVPRPTRSVQMAAVNKEQLQGAYGELKNYIQSKYCNPIIIRLAWHDAGTYDCTKTEFPQRGGANGAIRFQPELSHGHNAGLQVALALLKPMKAKYPDVSHADLFQMASAAAIEAAGGPKIDMQYGRKDVTNEQAPMHGSSATAADHIRQVFNRMGFNDQEIVVLSGAHTLGRVRKDRSGLGVDETKYTKDGPGLKGGTSWTPDWLNFNNSYFTEVKAKRDADLIVMDTDACIFEDEGFRPWAEKYAADQDAFFADYAVAHKKLSELGVEWEEGAPVTI
ncbi:L-ascorbate peroxidase [Dunaliella salina]|uniref:L-ascorbate peroxidase n=1 Tax=Dunaliella salina TaxID=3046 RepID=A0ABQ7GT97_DUNSA|nr:L-ascorbate peroxidase [Dunaliella salina]|eukprot:KAF5837815.1 L-ascorbate peroxidase [Dunaliella salina]